MLVIPVTIARLAEDRVSRGVYAVKTTRDSDEEPAPRLPRTLARRSTGRNRSADCLEGTSSCLDGARERRGARLGRVD